MEREIVVCADHLTKAYKIYNKRKDMVKEAFSVSRKKYHTLYYSLSDVSFGIRKGEMLGIIGENGAGKSTLLKLLTGVTKPTEGSVLIQGKIAALLELGAGFNPNYTGMENIYLNGTMMGFTQKEMEMRVDQIVAFADIGEFIYQPVKNYSSGMFARLAFAVAINVEPEVLIVDEALSVGDIFFQNKCFRKIEELKEKGVTILYVSHDLASVKEMCDKVLWLEKGKVKMFGDCVEICNEYSNALLRNKDEIYNATVQKQSDGAYTSKEMEMVALPPIQYTNDSIISEELEIKSCYLVNGNGHITNNFKQGEKCSLYLVLESKVPLEKGIVGFSIATVKGMWVINSNSLISGKKKHIKIDANQQYNIEFSFQVPALLKGDYIFEVAVCDGEMQNYKTYTWLYNVLCMTVEGEEQQYALLNCDTNIEIFKLKGDM